MALQECPYALPYKTETAALETQQVSEVWMSSPEHKSRGQKQGKKSNDMTSNQLCFSYPTTL